MESECLSPRSQKPSVAPILIQINPVHGIPSCSLKIQCNIISYLVYAFQLVSLL